MAIPGQQHKGRGRWGGIGGLNNQKNWGHQRRHQRRLPARKDGHEKQGGNQKNALDVIGEHQGASREKQKTNTMGRVKGCPMKLLRGKDKGKEPSWSSS